ncbi:MAG: DEAD/DEAH box helicase family protein [Bifidobacteriaceae bacterium]|jgi:type I restriction enzyme R subunit|nr:DEAD/DEAH box helicase family protein [Bifidobacteriaceae bacterium]
MVTKRPSPRHPRSRHDRVDALISGSDWPDDQVIRSYPLGAGEQGAYVLTTAHGVPLAEIELARAGRSPANPLTRAIGRARRLAAPLAYATDGTRTVEHRHPADDADPSTGPGPTLPSPTTPPQRTVARLATPSEAWAAYLDRHHLTTDAGAAIDQPFAVIVRRDRQPQIPRYYQVTAVNRVVGAIAGGATRALLVMATGTGKTFVAAQIVAKLRAWHRESQPDRPFRVLYLADRDILLDQPIRHVFSPAFGEETIDRVHRDVRLDGEMYFASYQMLTGSAPAPGASPGMETHFPPDHFSLVIVDECHRGSARANSVWRGVLDYFTSAAQLGMTATPRDDTVNSYAYFGNPLFRYSLRDGIEDGYLAPWSVRRVHVEGSESAWTDDAGPHPASPFARTATHLSGVLRERPDARTVVFCPTVEAAATMRDALARANPDVVARHPDWVVRIVGVEEHRDTLLAEFTDPARRSPVVATTSRLLGTGVDIEDLVRVVLARPVNSTVEFKQMIGRGSRLYPPKGKTSFEIVDYVGASERFHDPDFDGFPADIRVQHVGGEPPTSQLPAIRVADPSSLLADAGVDHTGPVGDFFVDAWTRDPADRAVRAAQVRRDHGRYIAAVDDVAAALADQILVVWELDVLGLRTAHDDASLQAIAAELAAMADLASAITAPGPDSLARHTALMHRWLDG